MFENILRFGQLAAAVMTIGGLFGGIWILVKRPWRRWRATSKRWNDALIHVEKMAKELGANGGKSLADKITRASALQELHGIQLSKIEARVDGISDVLDYSIFEADDLGRWIRVNRSFEMQFGYACDDLAGHGWINLVDQPDRARVVEEWRHAVKDQRAFRCRTSLITRAGMQLVANVMADPTVNPPGDRMVGYLGRIELIVVRRTEVATS